MNKKVSAYISAFLVFFTFLFLLVVPIVAQESEVSCQDEANKIDEAITAYSSLKPQYLTKYQTLWVTVSGFVSKADVLGYDTSVLTGDLDELELLIDAFDSTHSDFISNLETAKTYTCSSDESLYVGSLRNVREALGEVRGATRDLYNFYSEELKGNIISLVMLELKEDTNAQ